MKDREIEALFATLDAIDVSLRQASWHDAGRLAREWRAVDKELTQKLHDQWQDLLQRIRASGVSVP